LSKLHNDELPSSKPADLVNNVKLLSVPNDHIDGFHTNLNCENQKKV